MYDLQTAGKGKYSLKYTPTVFYINIVQEKIKLMSNISCQAG